MINLTVRKIEIDIPERDIQSKSPSDCSIDLFSILWFYCRLWFIVSDDERFDLKRINIFHWKTVIPTAVISLQSYLLHRFTVKPVKPFLYVSPIFLGTIVVLNLITSALVSLPRPWREFSGYRWILSSAKVHSSLMTVSLKRQFLLYTTA